jgi:WD40 repeat protein
LNTSDGKTIWSVKHSGRFYCFSLADDEGTVAVGSQDQTIRLYDSLTGEAKGVYRSHTDWVNGIAFLRNSSRLVSVSADGTVRLWNELCSNEGRRLTGHTSQVRALAFSADGYTLASASLDGSIGLWDTATGLLRQRLRLSANTAHFLALSPDGRWLAVAPYGSCVFLWNLRHLKTPETSQRAASFETGLLDLAAETEHSPFTHRISSKYKILYVHEEHVAGMAFSPDGSLLATASGDDTVRVSNVANGSTLHVFRAEAGNAISVAFSPCGKWLVSGHDDGAARVWSLADGVLLFICNGHHSFVRGVCFSPDGTWFASCGGDGATRIWSSQTGAELRALHGHDGAVHSVAVSLDCTRIVTGGNDQTVKLWDLRSGQELRTLQFGEQVRSVAISPDGQRIAASGINGTILAYEAGPIDNRAFASPAEKAPSAFGREAIGFVVHLMERGLSRPKARTLLGLQKESGTMCVPNEESTSATKSEPSASLPTIKSAVRDVAVAILDQYPLDEFASHQGHKLAISGDWTAAAEAFARACEFEPHDFVHWRCRALCELKAGRPEEFLKVSRALLDQFNGLQHQDWEVFVLDTCLVSAGLPTNVLQGLEHQFRKELVGGGRWNYPTRAQLAIRSGDFRTAEEILAETPLELSRMRWYYTRAICQSMLDMPEARQSFEDAQRDFATMTLPWSVRVYYELLRDEAREAIERNLGKPE